MTTPQASSPYGNAADWAQVLQSVGQGANTALTASAQNQGSKYEAKEAKRRTLASMMNNAAKRRQGAYGRNLQNSGEMNEYQAKAMQDIARGFVSALHGSTGG